MTNRFWQLPNCPRFQGIFNGHYLIRNKNQILDTNNLINDPHFNQWVTVSDNRRLAFSAYDPIYLSLQPADRAIQIYLYEQGKSQLVGTLPFTFNVHLSPQGLITLVMDTEVLIYHYDVATRNLLKLVNYTFMQQVVEDDDEGYFLGLKECITRLQITPEQYIIRFFYLLDPDMYYITFTIDKLTGTYTSQLFDNVPLNTGQTFDPILLFNGNEGSLNYDGSALIDFYGAAGDEISYVNLVTGQYRNLAQYNFLMQPDCWTPDGKLKVLEYDASNTYIRSVILYDPDADRFLQRHNLPGDMNLDINYFNLNFNQVRYGHDLIFINKHAPGIYNIIYTDFAAAKLPILNLPIDAVRVPHPILISAKHVLIFIDSAAGDWLTLLYGPFNIRLIGAYQDQDAQELKTKIETFLLAYEHPTSALQDLPPEMIDTILQQFKQ